MIFIHSNPIKQFKDKKYSKILEQFDLICCVSEEVKRNIIMLDNKLEEKTVVIYNIIDYSEINMKSLDEARTTTKYQFPILLTVGRISPEKGVDMAIEVVKLMKKSKMNFSWLFVGGGITKYIKKIEKKIKKYNLEEYVHLLGECNNPYKYMRMCDIYVQPSLDETYGITSAEAKMLNKVVIRTDTPGAREQFENRKDGVIVPISVKDLYKGIVELITNDKLYDEIAINLKNEEKDGNCIDQIDCIERLLSNGKEK